MFINMTEEIKRNVAERVFGIATAEQIEELPEYEHKAMTTRAVASAGEQSRAVNRRSRCATTSSSASRATARAPAAPAKSTRFTTGAKTRPPSRMASPPSGTRDNRRPFSDCNHAVPSFSLWTAAACHSHLLLFFSSPRRPGPWLPNWSDWSPTGLTLSRAAEKTGSFLFVAEMVYPLPQGWGGTFGVSPTFRWSGRPWDRSRLVRLPCA